MVFIVAEIGVNWDGDFQLMEKMIQSAKSAGCNAVKFQAYNLQNVKDHPERKRLLKSAITESNIETVDSLAKKIGIEWFCTPMYPESVDFLNPYLGRLKVREIDGRPLIQNKLTPLLEKILNSGKEIIISSQEIGRAHV